MGKFIQEMVKLQSKAMAMDLERLWRHVGGPVYKAWDGIREEGPHTDVWLSDPDER